MTFFYATLCNQPQKPLSILKALGFLGVLLTYLSACTKEPNTVLAPVSTADFYMIGNLDGVDARQEVSNQTSTQIAHFNDYGQGVDYCTFGYGCALGTFGDTDPMFQVSFPQLFSGDCNLQKSKFHGLFRTGAWQYGASTGKVEITYFDGKESWSTSFGRQPKTAFFKVRSSYMVGDSQTLGGTFSCKLYNASGAFKIFENGRFVLNFKP